MFHLAENRYYTYNENRKSSLRLRPQVLLVPALLYLLLLTTTLRGVSATLTMSTATCPVDTPGLTI